MPTYFVIWFYGKAKRHQARDKGFDYKKSKWLLAFFQLHFFAKAVVSGVKVNKNSADAEFFISPKTSEEANNLDWDILQIQIDQPLM